MRVLVTGARGYLGSSLCRALEKCGHAIVRVSSAECDLTRQDALVRYESVNFDVIYHLAAWTQAGDFCLRHPGEQWFINQLINTHVLVWWQKRQPQAKLVCMGTSCSYDPACELTEGNYLSGMPIDSLFSYAMTKRMLYAGLLALHRQYGLRYLCLVPSTLYGPGYHTDGRQMHFIFDLIRKILRGRFLGETVTLWGDGYQRRELVHVEDFVRIMLTLVDSADNELINVGAGEDHTIREFAQMICDRVGYDAGIVQFDESRYVGARSKCLNVAKLRSLMPSLALTPIRTGLADTVQWFEREGRGTWAV